MKMDFLVIYFRHRYANLTTLHSFFFPSCAQTLSKSSFIETATGKPNNTLNNTQHILTRSLCLHPVWVHNTCRIQSSERSGNGALLFRGHNAVARPAGTAPPSLVATGARHGASNYRVSPAIIAAKSLTQSEPCA